MSRFIRRSDGVGGVDLSTCTISTNQPIKTSSSFCGSGRTLCDTSWDLVCCFYNTACTGCFGSSLRIIFPTHCYNQFDFTICGVCLSCNYVSVLFSNSNCACTTCTAGFFGCGYSFGYLVSIVAPCCPTNFCQGIPVYGNGPTCCSTSLGFNLKLSRTYPDNGIDILYCSNMFDTPCILYNQYKASIKGTCPNCAAWNSQCDCSCRFTTVILCGVNGCALCYTPEFNFSIYGRKNNSTCYTTWG